MHLIGTIFSSYDVVVQNGRQNLLICDNFLPNNELAGTHVFLIYLFKLDNDFGLKIETIVLTFIGKDRIYIIAQQNTKS